MPTLVFVHGACVGDAPWWWHRMPAPLAARGIGTVAVPLPSCGEAADGAFGGAVAGATGPRGDLRDDVAACLAAVAAAPEGPVALLGHSYGGNVITEAGADPRVTHLLYLTSVMPGEGDTQAGMTEGEPAPWLLPGDDGTIGVDPGLVRERFLQDCDADAVEGALARLTRQSLAPFTQAPRRVGWLDTPSIYIVCTGDLATPAEVQRRRARPGTRVVDIDAGHHPFLSRPEQLADLVAAATGW